MSTKSRSIYRCSQCAHVTTKWVGRCPACGMWETMTEETAPSAKRTRSNAGARAGATVPLPQVQGAGYVRASTTMAELDRVLGGGVVPGSVVLLGGDPGMGKSTLALQVCAAMGSPQSPALYVTGEESVYQIKQRADRLGITGAIEVLPETHVETVVQTVHALHPCIVVVDSIQTITCENLESSAGTVAQVRESAALLTKLAKTTHVPLILIAHVTKDGFIAGPKVLEHIVDTVLQFEGEGMYAYRILRSLKNRYGSTNEIGVFEMTSGGLRNVLNPSEALGALRHAGEPGIAIAAVIEGTRPLLVEVQALVVSSGYSQPQRVSTGYDLRRLQLLLAVLERRGGVNLRQQDVFVKVAGGLSVQDPAVDLAVAMAITSSVADAAIPANTAFVGEIGLAGEVRPVAFSDVRTQEAVRLGIEHLHMARSTTPKNGETGDRKNILRLTNVIHDVFSGTIPNQKRKQGYGGE